MSNADIPTDDRGNEDYDKYDDFMKKILLMMICHQLIQSLIFFEYFQDLVNQLKID